MQKKEFTLTRNIQYYNALSVNIIFLCIIYFSPVAIIFQKKIEKKVSIFGNYFIPLHHKTYTIL